MYKVICAVRYPVDYDCYRVENFITAVYRLAFRYNTLQIIDIILYKALDIILYKLYQLNKKEKRKKKETNSIMLRTE